MAYPTSYQGTRYSAPTTCNFCSTSIPDQRVHDQHFDRQGRCAGRGYETIEKYIAAVWPTWFAQQKQAAAVAKGLHWKGKVWDIGTCVICKREKQALSKETQTLVGGQMIKGLIKASLCRLCLRTMADELERVASEMSQAHHGGERK